MPFGIQPLHIVVIVVVALIIFGPSRLPEIGRGLGKALNEFRKGTREMTEGFRDKVAKSVESASAPAASATSVEPETAGGNFCTQCGATNFLSDAILFSYALGGAGPVFDRRDIRLVSAVGHGPRPGPALSGASDLSAVRRRLYRVRRILSAGVRPGFPAVMLYFRVWGALMFIVGSLVAIGLLGTLR